MNQYEVPIMVNGEVVDYAVVELHEPKLLPAFLIQGGHDEEN